MNEAIDKVVTETRAFLARENYVADSEGLIVEVIVQVSGKAWPKIPGVTSP